LSQEREPGKLWLILKLTQKINVSVGG